MQLTPPLPPSSWPIFLTLTTKFSTESLAMASLETKLSLTVTKLNLSTFGCPMSAEKNSTLNNYCLSNSKPKLTWNSGKTSPKPKSLTSIPATPTKSKTTSKNSMPSNSLPKKKKMSPNKIPLKDPMLQKQMMNLLLPLQTMKKKKLHAAKRMMKINQKKNNNQSKKQLISQTPPTPS